MSEVNKQVPLKEPAQTELAARQRSKTMSRKEMARDLRPEAEETETKPRKGLFAAFF